MAPRYSITRPVSVLSSETTPVPASIDLFVAVGSTTSSVSMQVVDTAIDDDDDDGPTVLTQQLPVRRHKIAQP
jgi:hypothetical protein